MPSRYLLRVPPLFGERGPAPSLIFPVLPALRSALPHRRARSRLHRARAGRVRLQRTRPALGPALALFALALLAGPLLAPAPAEAQLRVDVERGFFAPLPVALPPFFDPAGLGLGAELAEVAAADLERSGLFRPVDSEAFLQEPASLARGPRFGDWRLIDAQLLLAGRIQPVGAGRFRAEFRLYDTLSESEMLALAFTSETGGWRRVAHLIADRVYARVLGEEGYFDSRIVYVAESGNQRNPQKRLAVMDQDGHNHKFLTDGSYLVLTPRFSPEGTRLVYLSYADGIPRVHLYDLRNRRETLLGDFPGMTFAPRFSPDGERVVMSLARNGNSDIYVMELASREVKRLTDHPAIDTSPDFSPDGEEIVFNSDRGGTQQIYAMNKDGSRVRRPLLRARALRHPGLVAEGRLGRLHPHPSRRVFLSASCAATGSGERMLARGFSVEGPTWSPNGRVISYFKEARADDKGYQQSRLYSIDISGYNERQIPTPLEASDPSWSPLNP